MKTVSFINIFAKKLLKIYQPIIKVVQNTIKKRAEFRWKSWKNVKTYLAKIIKTQHFFDT